MEPISSTTVTESPSSVPEAAPDSMQPMGGTSPAADTSSYQDTAPEAPAGPPRGDSYRQFQQGYQRRVNGERMRASQFNELQTRYERQIEQSNEALRQAIEFARTRGGQQEEEAIPDPTMDPQGFARWLRDQNNSALAQHLQPLQEHNRQQAEALAQLRGEQQQTVEQQRVVAQVTTKYENWEAEYQEAAPELAYGARDRYATVRDLMAASFEQGGKPPAEAQRMSNLFLHAIAQGAEAEGQNGVAAIDAFACGLVQQLTEAIGVPFVPVGMNGGGQQYYQPTAPVQRQQTEIQRLQNVRQRASAAGNAGPRQTARQGGQVSEVTQLFRAGVHNQPGGFGKIRQAALREAGGDGMKAAMIINSHQLAG